MLLNQAASLATGDPYFSYQAQQAQSYLSPYAKAGYYDPNNPVTQIASAGVMFVDPESAVGRIGGVESTVVRDATQANVITDPARMLPAPQQPLALLPERAESLANGTAYRAINPSFADSTAASGQFYQSGLPGRLGNDGIYANSTFDGAIAEFNANPKNVGITPAVFKVQYPANSPTLNISPPSGYFNSPLPFTGDANILTAPSLRAPDTMNFLIRNGAVPAGRIQ